MNSPSSKNTPNYKNLKFQHKQSPKELKEKMRKNYKDKVQNCREMLRDRFRGPLAEQKLSKTITDIYKSMFDFKDDLDNDEVDILEELKKELIQEEIDWWLKEYEKAQMDNVDWSSMEQDDNVICPLCQKCNFKIENSFIACSNCNNKYSTTKTLYEIKNIFSTCLEKHALQCTHEPQFTIIPDLNEPHLYLICESCSEMNALL